MLLVLLEPSASLVLLVRSGLQVLRVLLVPLDNQDSKVFLAIQVTVDNKDHRELEGLMEILDLQVQLVN